MAINEGKRNPLTGLRPQGAAQMLEARDPAAAARVAAQGSAVDTTPAQKVALSATSIEKKYIKKKNMFPLNIEGQVPHIYIKIFESTLIFS